MNRTLSVEDMAAPTAEAIGPGRFEPRDHFYPRVLNAQIHPLVSFFMRMGPERLISRYCHMNPRVTPEILRQTLTTKPRFFRWAGADLLHVTTAAGRRHMVVIETNSCPSGNKSMPIISDEHEMGGYQRLIEGTFLPMMAGRKLPRGGLAVLYDKNRVEAAGYAAAMAELTGETVLLTPFPAGREDAPARFVDGVLEVLDPAGEWVPIRGAFRYVTQRPWSRIPVATRTLIFNPVLACLAGGRNKLVAAKAYEFHNASLSGTGLGIVTPQTIRDLRREEVPFWVARFGGQAVVKVPYSNAGQGVYTITNQAELDAFMATEQTYERFIVQSLIGNYHWSSTSPQGRLYHVGTVPNRHGEIFAADVRVMVAWTASGFQPLAIYARRAAAPMPDKLPTGADSWAMLGTNLSERRSDGGWDADTNRLMLMDRRDFNALGLGLDDLVEAFIQTVLAVGAIDGLAQQLVTTKGGLRRRLFRSLNDDAALLDEVMG